MFQKNVGTTDRVVRLVLGIALIGAGWQMMTWWMMVVGVVVLATGLIGWCGLYSLLGVSTCGCKVENK